MNHSTTSTRRQRLETRAEKRRKWAAKARDRSAAAFEASDRAVAGIPPGQPILVGHHSQRRHERAIERCHGAMTRGLEEGKKADHHEARARGIETQLERSIFSDDDDAIEKLEEKAKACDESAANTNEMNRVWRRSRAEFDEKYGKALGLAAQKLGEDFSWLKIKPFDAGPDRAEARRCRKRIAELKARAERRQAAESAGGVLVEGDWHVRVTFEEKPGREVLRALRAAGFRWSAPSWYGARSKLPVEVTELVGESGAAS